MLFCSKVLEDTRFDGGLLTLMVGTPLVLTAILSTEDPRDKLLYSEERMFENGELVSKKMQYILELSDKQEQQ